MTAPTPERARRRSAAAAAVPAITAVNQSPMRPPAWYGGRSGRPRMVRPPASAWRVKSVTGRSAQGPLRP